MRAALLRTGAAILLGALVSVLLADGARADFLVLKNGRTYGGELDEYADGSVTTSEAEHRYDRKDVARASTEKTVDEVIENWSREIGTCETADAQESCLSLAKFCAFQKRYDEAARFFALWGKPRKWKVISSKYYFILSDAKPKRVREVRDRLDAVMHFYQKEFGAARELQRDFVVRFFNSERQFDAFAARAGAGGAGAFYDPQLRELVLWDMSLTNKNFTFASVYHEANHQYVGEHYLGFQPKHAWFSEGLATYYETVKFKGKRIIGHGRTSVTYLNALKEGMRNRLVTPPILFLPMQRNKFYCGGAQGAVNYAQAWGLVYFFKHTKDKQCQEFFERYVSVLRETKDDAKALREALRVIGNSNLSRKFKAFMEQL